MKEPIFILVAAFAAQMALAQGITDEGVISADSQIVPEQQGPEITYNGDGTVQNSATADGDMKVIDLLDSDVEVKGAEQPDEVKAEGGSPKRVRFSNERLHAGGTDCRCEGRDC
jgi:hypothetical protein